MSKGLSNPKLSDSNKMPRRMEINEFVTIAAKSGTGAHVTVPKGWIGKKVKVILLDEEGKKE